MGQQNRKKGQRRTRTTPKPPTTVPVAQGGGNHDGMVNWTLIGVVAVVALVAIVALVQPNQLRTEVSRTGGAVEMSKGPAGR